VEPAVDWSPRLEDPALQSELHSILSSAIDELPTNYRGGPGLARCRRAFQLRDRRDTPSQRPHGGRPPPHGVHEDGRLVSSPARRHRHGHASIPSARLARDDGRPPPCAWTARRRTRPDRARTPSHDRPGEPRSVSIVTWDRRPRKRASVLNAGSCAATPSARPARSRGEVGSPEHTRRRE